MKIERGRGIASANMDLMVQTDIQADEFVLSVHPFAPIFKGALYLNLHHNSDLNDDGDLDPNFAIVMDKKRTER